MVLVTAQRLSGSDAISLDLVSLLPKEERSPSLEAAADSVRHSFERKWVVLVGGEVREDVFAAAEQASVRLQAATGAREHTGNKRGAAADAYAFYAAHRSGLIDRGFAAQLASGDVEQIASSITRRYLDPVGVANSQLIESDPLLLLPAFLTDALPTTPHNMRFEDGLFSFDHDGWHYVPIVLELPGSPFSQTVQASVVNALGEMQDWIAREHPGMVMLSAGVVRHAAKGTENAVAEVSTVGLGSLVGVVALILFVFRTLQPLVAALVAIGAGIISGLFACLYLFDEVHILTLVFGGSLVGISVDYVFHYYCERAHGRKSLPGAEALAKIWPGITLGLLTTLIGFAGLWVAPFPGLRQMAVFSGAGLLAAYLTVCLWFPRFDFDMCNLSGGAQSVINFLTTAGQRVSRRVFTSVIGLSGIVLVIGIFRLTPTDDVRLFQSLDPAIEAEQEQVEAILSSHQVSQFFIVEDVSLEGMLQLEEALGDQLLALGQRQFDAVSRFVPSMKRQAENRFLLHATLNSPEIYGHLHATMGLSSQVLEAYKNSIIADANLVTVQAWLENPVSDPHMDLYLGRTGGISRSVVTLSNVSDLSALEDLADRWSGVHFIDTAGTYSRLFAKYREQTVLLAFLSYFLVGAVLIWRYGWRGMIAIMVTPVAATIASLGVLGWTGASYSLFNVMALLLALGISVDYGIFFREARAEKTATFIAVILSGVTTILAFGLLAFSGTAAIQAFGLTIFIGIAVALLISPIIGGYLKGAG